MGNEKKNTTYHALEFRLKGKYQEAIDIYSNLFDLEGKTPSLLDRGKTYLLMGNYQAALEDFSQAISLHDPKYLGESHYKAQGIAYWFLNQPEQAIQAWQQGLTAPYTDAAGGVELPALLFYGAERMKDMLLKQKSMDLLSKFVEGKKRAWPKSVAPFLLGLISSRELLSEIESEKNDILKNRFRCQADFYIGLRAYIENDIQSFKKSMKLSSESYYGGLQYEYYLAHWEVERDFPEPAFG